MDFTRVTRPVAQSAQYAQALEGLVWLGAVVAAVILATVIARIVWKRVASAGRVESAAFTLEDLRRLRDRGDLTGPEYEALRRKLLSDVQGSAGSGERFQPDNLL